MRNFHPHVAPAKAGVQVSEQSPSPGSVLTGMPAFAGTTLAMKLLEEIVPFRIGVHDLPQLPIAIPGLHGFLAGNCLVDPSMFFCINQSREPIALAKFGALAVPMLPHASGDIARDADVERPERLVLS
jgi:hypothetical protein